MPYGKRRNKGKQGNRPGTPPLPPRLSTSTPSAGGTTDFTAAAALPTPPGPLSPRSNKYDLILTSEKRRGVYECDYCHSDISQLPRIRCAVCPDFDLCLDCFATTDHAAAIARIRAANSAHEALVEEGTARAGGSGVSTAALHHDADSHGYRVCDSTRYPLFPTVRNVVERGPAAAANKTSATLSTSSSTMTLDDKQSEASGPTKQPEDGVDCAVADASAELASNEQAGETKTDDGDTTSMKDAAAVSIKEITEDEEGGGGGGASSSSNQDNFVLMDDPRNLWTVEEDLRLIEGIRSHGLGNWSEISDAVSGQGSSGKTPKRCMERYLDDFLGRYGRILPPFMLLMEEPAAEEPDDADSTTGTTDAKEDAVTVRASKRRAVLLRSPSASSNQAMSSRKKFKVVPTESVAGSDEIWPYPYLPPTGVQVGQEVYRDQAYKAEMTFVKLVSQLDREEAEKVRKHWEETKLSKPMGPTVLPMRPEDLSTLPGADLNGFMPRRGDFDVEWDNDAEQFVADMEFIPGEPQQDKELKLKVLSIYNARLDEREKRKHFVLSRRLYDYRAIQAEEQKLPSDERDLVHRMRLFERFHTPEEHKQFIADLLKAKRLRKEIAKLQMYRRLGIRTLAEAELYELEKARRSFHKTALQQKEAEATKRSDAAGLSQSEATSIETETVSSSLWKKYRTTDRKIRRSLNRGSNVDVDAMEGIEPTASESGDRPDTNESQAMELEQSTTEADNEQKIDANDVSTDKKDTGEGDSLSKMPGYNLLTRKEAGLCRKLSLSPMEYQEIKTAIIQESLAQGLLDKEIPASSRRSIVQIDVQRRGDVIDFMIRAGWVSPKAGNVFRNIGNTPKED